MMKSLVEDALAREPVAGAAASETAFLSQDQRVDAELEQILRSLKTNIKIIGVGGGGTNTIQRIYDEGIVGAELYAANTDAQHLLQLQGAPQDTARQARDQGARRRRAPPDR